MHRGKTDHTSAEVPVELLTLRTSFSLAGLLGITVVKKINEVVNRVVLELYSRVPSGWNCLANARRRKVKDLIFTLTKLFC